MQLNSSSSQTRNSLSSHQAQSVIKASGFAALACTLASCGDGYDAPQFQPYDAPNSVVIADLDGDGANDVAVAVTHVGVAYPDAGLVSVILQSHTTPGTFQRGVDMPIGTNPAILAVGDLNGVGGLDLVAANSSSANVSVLLQGTTAGQFLPASNVMISGTPNDVAVGDLNNDGLADIAVADVSNNSNVVVLFQDPANHGHYLAPITLAVGNPATSVAIGDVNGDSVPDMVVTSYDIYGNNGRVSVFVQDPVNHGQFLARADFPAGATPASVKIADLNGDGLNDLAIANQGPGSDHLGTSGVSVLLQSAATHGTFAAPVTYATAPGAICVAIGDLNGDNKPDLVVANLGGSWSGSISVLLQDPVNAGAFLNATNYAGVFQPLSVAIGDLNGDHLPDIAVADGVRATIMFQSATTVGTFAKPVMVGN